MTPEQRERQRIVEPLDQAAVGTYAGCERADWPCLTHGHAEALTAALREGWYQGYRAGAGRPAFPPDNPYYRADKIAP